MLPRHRRFMRCTAPMVTPVKSPPPVVRAVGHRKRAVAQVILRPGTGRITVNKVTVATFFPYATLVQNLTQGLDHTQTRQGYDVALKVRGGGFAGQAGACRLAICRALVKIDAGHKPLLRSLGLMTRDARVKERKKYGLRKARRAPQFSKR